MLLLNVAYNKPKANCLGTITKLIFLNYPTYRIRCGSLLSEFSNVLKDEKAKY